MAAAIVERALALSTLDRGTVKLNKTAIKVRAKQKTRQHTHTHSHAYTHAHAVGGGLVLVSVSVAAPFFQSFLSIFCWLWVLVFFLRGVRACAKIFFYFFSDCLRVF